MLAKNVGLIYKRTKTMYLQTLACKSQEFFAASFHRSTAFTFVPVFVAYSTTQTICCDIIAAGQITHRIPHINNWKFWFCRFKRVWLPAKLVILSISDSVPDKVRNLLEDTLPNKMIIKNCVVIKLIYIRKIRLIMASSRKYRQNVWNTLYTFAQYWWTIQVYLLSKKMILE